MPDMDLADRQREVVGLYMGANYPRTKEEIASEMDISREYASKLAVQVKEELDIEITEVDEAGTRAYKLAPHEKQKTKQGL